MKKIICILLSLILMMTLAACLPEGEPPTNDDNEHIEGGNQPDDGENQPDGEHTTHVFSEWYVIEEATCQTEGLKEATCNCGEKNYITIPTVGHKMVDSICTYCGREFSQGLAFESFGDGTCAVTGMGECTDSDLVIPDVSPEGDIVIEIGYNAFKNNEIIESVYIPATVITCGGFCFENCQLLSNITVDEANEKYKSVDGNLYTNAFFTLIQYAIGKTDSHFAIPFGVTSIDYSAFYGSAHLESIYMPDTVKYVNGYAFLKCSKLAGFEVSKSSEYFESLDGHLYTKGIKELVRYAPANKATVFVIPDGVETLGMMSFAYSQFLKDVYVPASIKSLESFVFDECTSLESFYVTENIENIPDSITEIPQGMFNGCTSLKNVIIPDGIKEIGKYAFSSCAIESISIPGSVETIGEYAFFNCVSLESVTMEDGLKSIGKSAFDGCVALKLLDLPSSLISIERSAFWNCNALESVVLPTSLQSIGIYAFFCENLSVVYYLGSMEDWAKVEYQTDSIFKDELLRFYSPEAPTETGYFWRYVDDAPTVWEEALPVPENVFFFESNGDGSCILSFILELNNPNVVIPETSPEGETVKIIGYSAFSHNSDIITVTIPDNVEVIEGHAFSSMDNLTSVILGNGVKTIGSHAFAHSTSLISLSIPDSVESIGNNLFHECYGLKEVRLGSGITDIPEYCFYGCNSLESINLPENLITIGTYAFYSCDLLKEVTIPKTVNKIDTFAFLHCYSIQSFTVDEENTEYASIDGNLYNYDRTTLINYAIGKGEEEFFVPEGVNELLYYSIEGCKSLKVIHIPESVYTIWNNVFENCSSLTDVYYAGDEFSWSLIYVSDNNEYLLNANIHYGKTE